MKSTHSGHCQACGRLQKLPSGKMSLHGYNVAHGFFSGVCRGARHEPFEVSCALVATFINEARVELADVEARQHELRTSITTECIASVRHENPKGRYYSAIYRDEHVTITARYITYDHDTAKTQYVRYTFIDSLGRVHGENISEGYINGPAHYDDCAKGKTLEQLAQMCARGFNERHANHLEKHARSLREYIKWQTARVATWKPAPLLANNAKDNEGFNVEAAS